MDTTSRRKNQVYSTVLEGRKILSSSEDGSEICKALQKIGLFLPRHSSALLDSELYTVDQQAFQEEFCKHHYVKFLEFLCDNLSLEWYGRFGRSKTGNDLFNQFFLDGVPQDVLLVLCSAIQKSSPSFRQKKCILLLEEFFENHQLAAMLRSLCDTLPSPSGSTNHQTNSLLTQWDEVMTLLVTLPDRMANKLKTECSDKFHPDSYIPMVGEETLQALHYVHKQLSTPTDCSLHYVSQLISRLCLHCYTEKLFDVLLPCFLRLTACDFIWSRIVNRILGRVTDRSLEGIVEYLLRKTPWYGSLSRLLGDAVLTNTKLNFLLTNKFLFLRHYRDPLVIQNLIGYLASSPTRRLLVVKVLRSVLDTWGDRSAIKNTAHVQHAYLTMVIVCCVGHMTEDERKQHKTDMTSRLMGGVQAHLESPLPRVRRLGMVAAEIITRTLDPDGPKLQFEYEEDGESRLLWSLVKPPVDPGLDEVAGGISGIVLDSSASTNEGKGGNTSRRYPHPTQGDEDLDSDDEFEPYDMSNDTKMTETKVPVYIRDCMDGLVARENPDLTEASLKVAEKLIRDKPDDLKDVCGQLAAILLHLDDQYKVENFKFMRHAAMVALTVNCPLEATDYLTNEFYNRNYNIRQRMDILEVLGAAAQELAKPTEDPGPTPNQTRGLKVQEQYGEKRAGESEAESWSDIVQRRIESKTRRFAKGPSKPVASPVVNRFSPVAGNFFFPLLMAYDRKLNTMDLLGCDFLLLGRLMYTLGVIMYAAQHAPVCRQMATCLLDIVWSLRYHTEQYVRQSLMFAVSMVTLSVPSHLLVSDLQSDIMECHHWLENIVEKDPEPECKALAAQTLVVIDSTIKKELT